MTAKVFHAQVWGKRESKYSRLLETDVKGTDWTELSSEAPLYLFVPRDIGLSAEYERGWSVTDIFPVNSVGIVTARDSLTIHWTSQDVWQNVSDFGSLDPEDARAKYNLGKDVQDWKVELAQADVRSSGPRRDKVVPILYRPFDVRFTYYTGKARGFICRPRDDVMCHMINGENRSLVLPRKVELPGGWAHVLVSSHVVEHVGVSLKTIDYAFPAYLYPVLEQKAQAKYDAVARHWPPGKDGRRPNLDRDFVADIETRLDLRFMPDGTGTRCTAAPQGGAVSGASRPPQSEHEELPDGPVPEGQPSGTFGPEDIFHYIYAIFHSPTYRKRYAEFLKRDFPRVPLTSDLHLFRQLCYKGADLVALHLTESDYPAASWNRAQPKGASPLEALLTRFPVKGDDVVENVFYLAPGEPEPGTGKPLPAGTGRVYISKDSPKEGKKGQYFEGVPPEVWEFHVGGYQVCQKWLKDRKGRVLTYDDLTHYQNIVSGLGETIRLMAEIDKAIEEQGGWPIQ